MAEFGQQLQFSNIHCRSAATVVGYLLSLRCSLNSDMATLRPRNLPMYTLIVNVDRTVHSLLETATAFPLQLLQLRRLDDRIFQTQLGRSKFSSSPFALESELGCGVAGSSAWIDLSSGQEWSCPTRACDS